MSDAPGRLIGVQYLRAVAAIMVVYFHVVRMVPNFAQYLDFREPFETKGLAAGVHVFFVISGFIMLATTTRSQPADFAFRRGIRIVPLYWLLTTLMALLILLPPHLFQHTEFTPGKYIKSLLFFGYMNEHDEISPLVTPGWTLNIEVFFYCVFAVALILPVQRRLPVVGALLLVLVLIGRFVSAPQLPALYQITRPWMLEFVLGMAIARAWLKGGLKWPAILCYGLIIVGTIDLFASWTHVLGEEADYVVPATLIVLGVVALEQGSGIAVHPLPALLGDASYSIYLSHFFTVALVKVVWTRLGWMQGGWMQAWSWALAAVLGSIVAAIATYYLLEKPLLKGLQRWHRHLTGTPDIVRRRTNA
jgi:exopolysaccharide production protein ExoZ